MTTFNSLIGQPQVVELLTQAIKRNRVPPAYLFAGSSGVGKRLAAEAFVKLLVSDPRQRVAQRNHPDVLWVEPTYLHQGKRLSLAEAEIAGVKKKTPPQVRLDQVREISLFLSRPPLEADRSIVIIDQAETMAEPAANALLKTLEEPGRATLILLAPSADSLLPTLVSRCQRIPFYRLNSEAIAQVLSTAGFDEILLCPQILALAQGSPGDAIVHWQKFQTIPPELLQAVTHLPKSLRETLTIARQITKTLDSEAQLWLVDYLQQTYWQQAKLSGQSALPLQLLEKARDYLLAYVQSQLVWEVTLLGMMQV
ncbi:MAG: DNA polymerase III subunit delta' [Candidatus Parcubacteria bacterium]|uniref:DNA polymerase III subunit delta' n=1 Tax=Phormidesmis priestleyi TaxID=268141 RepID=UPI00083A9FFB|nr:DNA polymerase III subunit delta' [Phormidesmis priestleyi]MBC7824840.1 DNA polymerase III subunit delta' [Leptolyngbyaceae cyanobacterium LF-bin-113]